MSKRLTFEDFNTFSELFRVYGVLLTHKQQEILESYFSYNLSLREIAENLHVSSSAIHDTVQKSVLKLQNYEAHLGLIRLRASLGELENTDSREELLKKIKEIHDGI